MAIEHKFETIRFDGEIDFGQVQSTVECNIDTSAKGGAAKLLSVSGRSEIIGADVTEGEAMLKGRLNLKVICLNIEGALQSYDYFSDYNCSIKHEGIKAGVEINADACVIDIDSSISGNMIRLQAVVDNSASGIVSDEVGCLCEINDELLARYADTSTQIFKGCVKDKFVLTEEYESGVNVEKVLLFTCECISCGIKMCDKSVTLNGTLSATVVYESGGTITTKNFNIPYSEQLDSELCAEELRARVRVWIDESKIVLAGVEDDNILRLEFTCGVRADLYENCERTVIDDVCSPAYKVDVIQNIKKVLNYECQICRDERISGSAELGEEMMSVRRILAVCPSRNCLTNVYADDGCFTAEGILACNVIYEDINMSVNCVQVELPYSLPFEAPDIKAGDILDATAMAEVLGAKVKREREIDVSAIITISVGVVREYEFSCVSAIEIGEATECKIKALCVYQAGEKETLWDIAKNLCAPIESIVEQNPWLKECKPCEQKVVYYRQI